MIELTNKDIHPFNSFAPQEALKKVNEVIKEKLREQCRKAGHIPELYKKGEVTCQIGDFDVEPLLWRHRCRFCGVDLRPIAFEEI